MKLKFWNAILILVLFSSCQDRPNLDGNYSMCSNGEYTEVYFKQDSMRVASENEWVKLSKWKKIEIKNDTLHFETYGEWRKKRKAEIIFIGKNKIELRILEFNEILNLERINGNLSLDNSVEFWNGFNNRWNSNNCK